MAINLGDVNFRLGADARSLGKTVRELKTFGRVVDQAAQKATKGSQKTANALRRQEKAASDALRTVQQMNQRFRNYDFGTKLVRQANRAYRDYAQTLTMGKLSANDFLRTQTQFKSAVASTNREFMKLKGAAQRPIEPTKRLQQLLRDMASTSVLVSGPLGGVAARLSSLSHIAGTSGASIAALMAGVAGGIYTVQRFGSAVINAGRNMEIWKQQLLAVSGDMLVSNSQFRDAVKIANDSGQAINGVIPAYAKFTAASKGTNLEGERSSEIFRTISLVMARLQAPTEQTTGVLKALEQMLSKGTVQAEELRGQLGDRLPGAFQIAARAMGLTTKELGEMTKKGELLSDEFLPKFAEELRRTFGLEGVNSIDNFATSINRLQNEYTMLLQNVDQTFSITKAAKNALDSVTNALKVLGTNISTVTGLFAGMTAAAATLAAPAIISSIGTLAVSLRSLTTISALLNATLLANPFILAAGAAGVLAAAFVKVRMDAKQADATVSQFFENLNQGQSAVDQASIRLDNLFSKLSAMKTVEARLVLSTNIDKTLAKIEELQTSYSATIEMFQTNASGLANFNQDVVDAVTELDMKFKAGQIEIQEYFNSLEALEQANPSMAQVIGALQRTVGQLQITGAEVDVLTTKLSNLQMIQTAFDSISGIKISDDLTEALEQRAQEERHMVNLVELQKQYQRSREKSRVGGESLKAIEAAIKRREELAKASKKATDESVKMAETQSQLLAQYGQELDDIIAKTAALNAGPAEFADFEALMAVETQVRAYKKSLEEAGFATEFITMKTGEFRQALEGLQIAEETAATIKMLSDTGSSAIDSFMNKMVDDLFAGELSLHSLADAARAVAADIVKTFIQLSITNPLKNWLFGIDTPTLGLGGSGGSGIFSGITSFISSIFGARNGAAFGSMGVEKMANGGILSRPTIMHSNTGPVLGGEGGQEAVMPLERTSSGQLGVLAMGGGDSAGAQVFINIIDNVGNQITQTRRTDDSGDEIIDIKINSALTAYDKQLPDKVNQIVRDPRARH